ncbi:MAG: peptidylprolyl isomerase [Opitutaceae bacterium]|nr:peptidylprolyl isomerase [Opitutaceae bacterium]
MSLLEEIFRAVIATSWRASFLIGVLLVLRRGLRGQVAARLWFCVWIAVAVRLLLPVSLPTAWSPFNLHPWPAFASGGARPPAEVEAVPPEPVRSGEIVGRASEPSGGFPVTAGLSAMGGGALLWGGGVGVLLFLRFWAWGRFARRVRHSAVEPSPKVASRLTAAARALGATGQAFRITDAVGAPALHGILRPQILFPPGFVEQLSPGELRLVIAHELAHARRRDLLADAILHLAAVVHWFNPLAWVAARVARQECELACDESVLTRLPASERGPYGAALLRLARLTHGISGPRFTLGVVNARGQLKQRIQMITANRSFMNVGTLLGGALSLGCLGLSFTREATAQVTPAGEPPALVQAQPGPASGAPAPGIVYSPAVDRLDVLFPNGVVAAVADRTITVADVRRYIAPVVPKLQQDARTQEEFNGKLAVLQNSAVRDLVTRTLLIRQFHDRKEGEEPRQVAAEQVDTYVADLIAERFGGDRSKFLAHLKARGQTQRDHRQEIEEEIIYNYMRAQERKASGTVARPTPARDPRTIHLRIIQLTRAEGETDAALLEKANAILARFRNGERFEHLAREFDQSGRRERGGDWGWQGPADLRAEYRDAVLALQKGTVSAPIVVREACLLLYAEDRR